MKLPYAISTAKTEAQLEELAQLGLSKWVPLPSLLSCMGGPEPVARDTLLHQNVTLTSMAELQEALSHTF